MRNLLLALFLLGVPALMAGEIETWSGPWLPWPQEERDLGTFYLSLIPPTLPETPEPVAVLERPAVLELETRATDGPAAQSSVPEPASYILIGAGIVAVSLLGRRFPLGRRPVP